jgi:hypothetical protein
MVAPPGRGGRPAGRGFNVSPAAAAGERGHSAIQNIQGAGMQTRKLRGLIAATTMGVVALATLAASAQPGTPKLRAGAGNVLSISAPPNGFLGGSLVTEVDGPPVAAYGILKLANQPRYTYLILFKADPKKQVGGGIGMGDLDKGDKGRKGVFDFGDLYTADLPLWVTSGGKKFEFTYKLKADSQKGVILSESLKIGDKEYEKDIPRVLLVDLTQAQPACLPVKNVQPAPAPDVGGGLEKLEQAIRELKEKNAEVKEFFEGKAKK